MENFNIYSKTMVYFGDNCTKNALKSEEITISKRALLVTSGKSLKKYGYIDKLLSYISSEIFIYDCISPNPDVSEIQDAITIGKENSVETIIGFGGGSAIDAAKAVSLGIASNINIKKILLGDEKIPDFALPIVAIPTTSGTGAEVTKGAIISYKEKKIKSGIRSDILIPKIAIIDPVYTYSMPLKITMESGFDVLAHAIEGYCAAKSNIFSEMLSEQAIKIVSDSLPRLKENLDDHKSRYNMSFASHIMGYNVLNVGTCLPHRLQYPIGATTDTSHGSGLIAIYPSWIKYQYTVNPEKIDRVLDWLGCDYSLSPEEKIRKWLDNLNLSVTLTCLGNKLSPLELAAKVTGNLNNDNLYLIDNIIEKIYSESL